MHVPLAGRERRRPMERSSKETVSAGESYWSPIIGGGLASWSYPLHCTEWERNYFFILLPLIRMLNVEYKLAYGPISARRQCSWLHAITSITAQIALPELKRIVISQNFQTKLLEIFGTSTRMSLWSPLVSPRSQLTPIVKGADFSKCSFKTVTLNAFDVPKTPNYASRIPFSNTSCQLQR